MTKTIYLGLGSNVGDRKANLIEAARRIGEAGIRVLRASPIYETEPVQCDPQRWFYNQALEAETSLFPLQLLARVQKIEREMGRVRKADNAPRTIDIDVLLYGAAVIETPSLTAPHPRLAERRFALAPLVDLSPTLRHPGNRRTVKELLDAAPAQTVRRLEE